MESGLNVFFARVDQIHERVQIRKTFLDTQHEKMSNFQVAQKR